MLTARETLIAEAKQRENADRVRRWAAVSGIDPEMRMALREAALAAEVAAVHARTLAELLEDVLATLTDAEPGFASAPRAHANAQPEAAPLSPREREVWALVAEGRSNKAIAAALFVSPNTVKTHVASLLAKLNADTRTQLAAMAARREAALVR